MLLPLQKALVEQTAPVAAREPWPPTQRPEQHSAPGAQAVFSTEQHAPGPAAPQQGARSGVLPVRVQQAPAWHVWLGVQRAAVQGLH
jgi:hypothetical protein